MIFEIWCISVLVVSERVSFGSRCTAPQVCHGLRNPLHAALGLLDVVLASIAAGGAGGDRGASVGGESGRLLSSEGLSAGVMGECIEDLAALGAELRAMRAVLNAVRGRVTSISCHKYLVSQV